MYFLIQKVLKVPSLEKVNEHKNQQDFKEELLTYYNQLKICMKKRNIKYFTNSGPVYYKCYITGCNKIFRFKRDLAVHLRNHVLVCF
jgi:hypothetical protein